MAYFNSVHPSPLPSQSERAKVIKTASLGRKKMVEAHPTKRTGLSGLFLLAVQKKGRRIIHLPISE